MKVRDQEQESYVVSVADNEQCAAFIEHKTYGISAFVADRSDPQRRYYCEHNHHSAEAAQECSRRMFRKRLRKQ